MEILPNLYFAYLYRRSYNSSKNPEDNEINGQAARSRHTVEVTIRNSSVQQLFSQDLSNNVATILQNKALSMSRHPCDQSREREI